MSAEEHPLAQKIQNAHCLLNTLKEEIGKVIVGQEMLIESLLVGLLADGHILLEGVPGIAKTLAANTLAQSVRCDFKRIQFTPDLLPGDLIGTTVYNAKDGSFEVKKGPIFTNILLADEINRAPCKVQSALLEVMQEKQVTIGNTTYSAPSPFLVIATQNPVEQEGTYPLAEAQTDRFLMKVKLHYPSRDEEKIVLQRMGTSGAIPQASPVLTLDALSDLRNLTESIYLDDRVVDYILDIVQATRDPKKFDLPFTGLLEYGSSPRASLAFKKGAKALALLKGRYFVTPQDIKDLAPAVLRHRLHLSYEAEAENLTSDDIVKQILQTLTVP